MFGQDTKPLPPWAKEIERDALRLGLGLQALDLEVQESLRAIDKHLWNLRNGTLVPEEELAGIRRNWDLVLADERAQRALSDWERQGAYNATQALVVVGGLLAMWWLYRKG